MKYLILPLFTLLFISCAKNRHSNDKVYSVEEYEITIECPDCDGDGYNIYTCNTCDGEGSVTRTGTSYHNEPATCTSCWGTGTVRRGSNVCEYCSGYGSNTCITCEGSGLVYLWGEYNTCPGCKGTGRQKCYLCGGTGDWNNEVTCEECWGSGKSGRNTYSSSYDIEETCSSCDGEGRYRNECSTCNGTGKITETRTR